MRDDCKVVYMETTGTSTQANTQTIVLCRRCGFRADADPQFHAERYGHWPTIDHEGTLYNSNTDRYAR